jgi:hypothetical protein
MADDEQVNEEQVDVTIPEMWSLAKPPAAHGDDEDLTEEQKKAAAAAAGGPKVGKLIKYLNDIEDQEELETKIQERDPATNHSLLLWATLTGKFVVVEWLVKKAKRNAFAFGNEKKELTVFDKWVEIRKEVEDREREKLLNPPEEDADADDEEKQPDPTADQLVFEALSEFHEEWAERANCIVKSIGELGVYQGNRDEQGTKCGLGQTLFPDGDMYTGEYRDNQRHGRGTYFWANHGMIYCGQWAGNKRHGVGRMIFADGARYFGAWADDKIHGVGRYTYPDGSTYNGAWVDGQKHGEGAYTFVDGSRYSGAFVDGEFVSGEWILGASGTRYVGRFKNGVPSGKGVFVFKSRDGGSYRQEGEYVAGKWIPGPLSNKGATPAVELVVQRRSISVGFTAECAALSAEDLVRAINFEPFRTWLDGCGEQLDILHQWHCPHCRAVCSWHSQRRGADRQGKCIGCARQAHSWRRRDRPPSSDDAAAHCAHRRRPHRRGRRAEQLRRGRDDGSGAPPGRREVLQRGIQRRIPRCRHCGPAPQHQCCLHDGTAYAAEPRRGAHQRRVQRDRVHPEGAPRHDHDRTVTPRPAVGQDARRLHESARCAPCGRRHHVPGGRHHRRRELRARLDQHRQITAGDHRAAAPAHPHSSRHRRPARYRTPAGGRAQPQQAEGRGRRRVAVE